MTELNVVPDIADIMHSGCAAPTLEQLNAYGYGHSYISGSAVGKTFWQVLNARAKFAAASAYASPGTACSDATHKLISQGITALTLASSGGGLVVLDSVCNDAGGWAFLSSGGKTTRVAAFKAALTAFLRVAMGGAHVEDTSGTYTGTWTPVTGQTGTSGGSYHSTVTQNDKVDIPVTVPASGVVTLLILADDPAGGSPPTPAAAWSVKNGATVLATGTAASQYDNLGGTYTPAGYGAFPIVLTGLAQGPIVLTLTKTDANGPILAFDCAIPEHPFPPMVCVMKDPTNEFTSYPPQALQQLDAAVDAVVATFTTPFGAGNGITVIDPVALGFDQRTMLAADRIHPNPKGCAFLAGAIMQAYADQPFWSVPYYEPPLIGSGHPYTALKTLAGSAAFIYSLDGTELPILPSGSHVVITGGAGFTPGLYVVNGTTAAFSTPDGAHNLVQLAVAPAAPGVAGASGYIAS
jgi:hypothetical protein